MPAWKAADRKATSSAIVEAYLKQALERRGLSASSLHRDRSELDRYVTVPRARHVSWAKVGVRDFDRYLLRYARRHGPATVERLASSLRGFLRFLHASGHIQHDLASAVVSPIHRSPDQPQRALSWPTVKKIIKAIDPTTPIGCRDRAQFLLMSGCGIGAAEVLQLQLSDIDWKNHRLRVFRCKTRTPLWLPLLPEIAHALAVYIRRARPRPTLARQVFLSRQIPFRPFTSSGVLRHRMRYLARKAGIDALICGTHCLRHSHATRQVELGTVMKTLADILGHRGPETTSLYVRAAVQRLRHLALPLP